MIRTYCFKLYSSKKNKYLIQSIELAAEIYNHCISLHKRYYRLYGKHLSKFKLQAHIVKLKKLKKYEHWNKLHSQAIQNITDRIENAYALFFNSVKRKGRGSPPSYKRVSKYKSFTLKNRGHRLLGDNSIIITGRKYKFFKSREIEGAVKTVTVKRDILGDMYVYIVCEAESTSVRERTGRIVGFDAGYEPYLRSSEGESRATPEFFKRNKSMLKKLNRSFARKRRGSGKREDVKRRLSVQQIKFANQRRDFQFKLANELCRKYDEIYINVPDRRQKWGRKSLSLAHAGFVLILKSQAAKHGVRVVEGSTA